jgi:ABC-type molybdate transport system substrate-binding protein
LKEVGTFVEIPSDFYPPIEQAAVVIASSKQKALAAQFVDTLKQAAAKGILRSYGFAVR